MDIKICIHDDLTDKEVERQEYFSDPHDAANYIVNSFYGRKNPIYAIVSVGVDERTFFSPGCKSHTNNVTLLSADTQQLEKQIYDQIVEMIS